VRAAASAADGLRAAWRALRARRPRPPEPPTDRRVAKLERRLEHLEAAFEGLQDAVHRDSRRHDAQIQALTRSTQPEAVARALNADARRRGL
jgi:hypothetical protein